MDLKQAANSEKDEIQSSSSQPNIKLEGIDLQMEGTCSETTPALNALLLLQAAASLSKLDAAISQNPITCGPDSETKAGCLPCTPLPVDEDGKTSIPVKSSDSDSEGEARSFSQSSFPESVFESMLPKQNATGSLEVTISTTGGLAPCDGSRPCLSVSRNFSSCARTSPCNKTSKKKDDSSEVTVKFPRDQQTGVGNAQCSTDTPCSKKRTAFATTETIKSPKIFPLTNSRMGIDGNGSVTTRTSTKPWLLSPPVYRLAGEGEAHTRVVSSSNGGKFRSQDDTAGAKESYMLSHNKLTSPQRRTDTSGSSLRSGPCSRNIYSSPAKITTPRKRAMACTVPAVRYFTVRQQLIQSRSPASEFQRKNCQASLIRRTVSEPNTHQTDVRVSLKDVTSKEKTVPTGQSGFIIQTLSAPRFEQVGPGVNLMHHNTQGTRIQIGNKIYSVVSSPKTGGYSPFQLVWKSPLKSAVTIPCLNRSPLSGMAHTPTSVPQSDARRPPAIKQTAPSQSDAGINPTLSKMMKHFNFSMMNLGRFIDDRFLWKLLSSDPGDVDDLFEDVVRSDRVWQNPVPNWLVEFTLEASARKKRRQVKGELSQDGLQGGTPDRQSALTAYTPKQDDQHDNIKCGLLDHSRDDRSVAVASGGLVAHQSPPHETRNFKDSSSSFSNMPGAQDPNVPQDKTSEANQSTTPRDSQSQRNLPTCETGGELDLGCLNSIPDWEMWNLVCSLFPPWKRTATFIGAGDVEEFFQKSLDEEKIISPSQKDDEKHQGQGTTSRRVKRVDFKTSKVKTTAGGEDGEERHQLTTNTKRKRNNCRKRKKYSGEKQSQEKSRRKTNLATTCIGVDHAVVTSGNDVGKEESRSKRNSKRKYKRKRKSRKNDRPEHMDLCDNHESFLKSTSSHQSKTHLEKKRHNNFAKEKSSKRRKTCSAITVLPSEALNGIPVPTMTELSCENRRQSENKQKEKHERHGLDTKCKSSSGSCSGSFKRRLSSESETQRETDNQTSDGSPATADNSGNSGENPSQSIPGRWKLKIILKSSRSKTRGKGHRPRKRSRDCRESSVGDNLQPAVDRERHSDAGSDRQIECDSKRETITVDSPNNTTQVNRLDKLKKSSTEKSEKQSDETLADDVTTMGMKQDKTPENNSGQ